LFIKEFRRDLQQILNTTDINLIDLVKKCLVFDPNKRLGVKEVLRHPYFSSYYDTA